MIKVLVDLVPGKSPPPGLRMATFSRYAHLAERGHSGVSFSSYKGINPITGALPP